MVAMFQFFFSVSIWCPVFYTGFVLTLFLLLFLVSLSFVPSLGFSGKTTASSRCLLSPHSVDRASWLCAHQPCGRSFPAVRRASGVLGFAVRLVADKAGALRLGGHKIKLLSRSGYAAKHTSMEKHKHKKK